MTDDDPLSSSSVSAADLKESGMQTLEHVAVTVTITHPCRGSLEVVLVCPSGMRSLMGARRATDRLVRRLKTGENGGLCVGLSQKFALCVCSDSAGYTDWTFSTVRCWGEKAEGLYILKISDHSKTTPHMMMSSSPEGQLNHHSFLCFQLNSSLTLCRGSHV